MNETALKDRLKVIAKEKGVTFNETWKQFLLERFLARLSRSKHQEKFIFKGGLLLAQYIVIGRETIDADFLMRKLKSEAPSIQSAFIDIISIDLGDKFQFEWDSIEELVQPHMEYAGFRISIKTCFGKMKDKIQVDIGVGDLVNPLEENIRVLEYKGKPIFEDEITLMVYPAETIFSEKLETIISKGAINSRMKDYHDLLLLSREKELLENKKLLAAIHTTFQHRGTNLKLPIQFDTLGIENLQKLWANHLRTLGAFKEQLNLPSEIIDAIQEINSYLAMSISIE
jgi:predicted nucleotidyltransferase component of viral defense system